MKCLGCDTPIPMGATKCPMCGASVQKMQPTAEPLTMPEYKPRTEPVMASTLSNKTCKYCAMSVPKAASICPYCRKKLGMSTLVKIILAVICLPFIAGIFSGIKGGPAPQEQSAPAAPSSEQIARDMADSIKSTAKWQAKQFVEASLKAPSTAKWPNYNEFAAAPVVGENDTWEVMGHVDSQNSYGAMLRTNWHVKMKKSGDTWQLIDISSN